MKQYILLSVLQTRDRLRGDHPSYSCPVTGKKIVCSNAIGWFGSSAGLATPSNGNWSLWLELIDASDIKLPDGCQPSVVRIVRPP